MDMDRRDGVQDIDEAGADDEDEAAESDLYNDQDDSQDEEIDPFANNDEDEWQ
jgi:hypothetical protein